MPDSRRHRGAHPEDAILFGQPENLHKLRVAAGDFAWLLGRHYAPQAARARRRRQVAPPALAGAAVRVDALNQIITIEAALAGGLLLRGHDGAWRDLASVHGTYRLMQETTAGLEAIGVWLAAREVREVEFLIDAVVSNSGRLAERIRTLGAAHGWPWSARLVPSPDPLLQHTNDIAATSDSSILDRAAHWCDLAAAVVQRIAPHAWCIDLDVPPPVVE